MAWKRWLLPLLCSLMCLVNIVQLVLRFSNSGHGSLSGQVLMTLFWLLLVILSFRGFSPGKRNGRD